MRFKIDTGADVIVIPEPLYFQTGLDNLKKFSRQLFGPGQSKLSVKGVIKGNLKTGNGKESTQEIYVVKNLKNRCEADQPSMPLTWCKKSIKTIVMTVEELSKKLKRYTPICLKVWES